QPGSHFFEGGAHGIGLAQSLIDEGEDVSSASRAAFDQAQPFEFAQRFAHGSLAGAEVFGDLRFDEALAALDLPGDDQLDESITDTFAQGRFGSARTSGALGPRSRYHEHPPQGPMTRWRSTLARVLTAYRPWLRVDYRYR